MKVLETQFPERYYENYKSLRSKHTPLAAHALRKIENWMVLTEARKS